jgi:Putative ATP-dependent DNA helicase recG C-terminal
MLRRLCRTVLTTNFDQLVKDALGELRPNVREIIEVNRTRDDLIRFSLFREFQIVYLHGAVEFYRDRNEEEETKKLDEDLVRNLRPLLRDSPLIVIGYRGSEASVMEHLLDGGRGECLDYPNGVFWCRRAGSANHENVERFRNNIGGNFHDVEIEGFDEALTELNTILAGNSRLHDIGGRGFEVVDSSQISLDSRPLEKLSKQDLETSIVLSTMGYYYERLHFGRFDPTNLDSVMIELGLLVQVGDKIVPSVGGYLLFGKDVTKAFPFARVSILIDGERLVIEGNLISQFDALTGFLNSPRVNPVLKIKGQVTSHEDTAYAPLALREACVNLLMHRDYEAREVAEIECVPGKHLLFRNPGGLSPYMTEQLQLAADGSFVPKRGATSVRNPMLADIFYGLGRMEKAGSGLADIAQFMVKQGGSSAFSTLADNTHVAVTLRQAAQEPLANTAVSLTSVEIFVTNLLPFVVMPQYLTAIPLRRKRGAQTKLTADDYDILPQFVYHDDYVISFAKPELFANYPDNDLSLEDSSVDSLEEILEDPTRRRLVVWLLHRHWAKFLWQFSTQGLTVEPRVKRAYFVHKSPYTSEASYVSYTSRMGRKIRRGVVKRRGVLDRIWHENEGINYSAITVDDKWAMQIKPMYVFTGTDGSTPLPAHAQTRRATRRFKFDRNKSVEDDLTFWSRLLSEASPVIDIGGIGVSDLVVSANYSQAEVPVSLLEDSPNGN